jgi:Ser/Thr protein kinase RdoA (MazF antagonist)
MGGHDLSQGGEVMERVRACAREALRAYRCHPDASVELLNVSENATFLVSEPDAGPSVLRVHRLGYHTEQEIASELAWMEALRAEAGVRTPRVLPAADGRRVIQVPEPGGVTARHCVRFEFLPGTEPGTEPGSGAGSGAGSGSGTEPGSGAGSGKSHFAELGEITARMHKHARTWARPAWFTRFHWDYDAAFGPEARWGRWQDGTGVGASELQILGRLDQTLKARLTAFGQRPQRYGLVHADTRLANLLVHDGSVAVIDFDDSGFSWYLYDLGTAVSFFEHAPEVPELVGSWLAGYREAGELSAEDEAEIWTFILFRRLLLVAWIGSHRGVDIAAELGAGYTRGSCDLAETYLSTH